MKMMKIKVIMKKYKIMKIRNRKTNKQIQKIMKITMEITMMILIAKMMKINNKINYSYHKNNNNLIKKNITKI